MTTSHQVRSFNFPRDDDRDIDLWYDSKYDITIWTHSLGLTIMVDNYGPKKVLESLLKNAENERLFSLCQIPLTTPVNTPPNPSSPDPSASHPPSPSLANEALAPLLPKNVLDRRAGNSSGHTLPVALAG